MGAFFPASAAACHYGAMQRRRLIVIAAIAMLVVGAFLLWGPIGLGNGPLSAAMYASVGGPTSGRVPVGFMIGMHNSGHAPAVIDKIELVGGTRYPAPRLLALAVMTSGHCGGPWPTRPFRPPGFGFPAAAEVSATDPYQIVACTDAALVKAAMGG
jgi:hypothetical protein